MAKVPRGGQVNPLRMLNPLFLLRRNALYRSLAGDKAWMAVAAVVWGPVLLRRALGKHSERVAVEPLAIGHVLRLEVLPQGTKVERKAYRRTK